MNLPDEAWAELNRARSDVAEDYRSDGDGGFTQGPAPSAQEYRNRAARKAAAIDAVFSRWPGLREADEAKRAEADRVAENERLAYAARRDEEAARQRATAAREQAAVEIHPYPDDMFGVGVYVCACGVPLGGAAVKRMTAHNAHIKEVQ